MKTLKHRATPWDEEVESPSYLLPPAPPDAPEATSQVRRGGSPDFFFCLHGLYVFNPDRSTSADFRQFMWAGLHVLRAEAQGRGLSEEDLRRLLAHAFDAFHDAADGIWSALRNMVSQVGQHASAQPEQAPCGPFVPGVSERMPPAAPPGAPESPEQAELRRLSILLEEQAAYNRACHDEEMRDLLDD